LELTENSGCCDETAVSESLNHHATGAQFIVRLPVSVFGSLLVVWVSSETGLSVQTTDADDYNHSIVIEVKDPHSLKSSCPAGVSPCLADGSLRVVLDGEEALQAPGTVHLGEDVQISAVTLPGACRSFGFEKVRYCSRKGLERKGDITVDYGFRAMALPAFHGWVACFSPCYPFQALNRRFNDM